MSSDETLRAGQDDGAMRVLMEGLSDEAPGVEAR
jgi:hypothetical protein